MPQCGRAFIQIADTQSIYDRLSNPLISNQRSVSFSALMVSLSAETVNVALLHKRLQFLRYYETLSRYANKSSGILRPVKKIYNKLKEKFELEKARIMMVFAKKALFYYKKNTLSKNRVRKMYSVMEKQLKLYEWHSKRKNHVVVLKPKQFLYNKKAQLNYSRQFFYNEVKYAFDIPRTISVTENIFSYIKHLDYKQIGERIFNTIVRLRKTISRTNKFKAIRKCLKGLKRKLKKIHLVRRKSMQRIFYNRFLNLNLHLPRNFRLKTILSKKIHFGKKYRQKYNRFNFMQKPGYGHKPRYVSLYLKRYFLIKTGRLWIDFATLFTLIKKIKLILIKALSLRKALKRKRQGHYKYLTEIPFTKKDLSYLIMQAYFFHLALPHKPNMDLISDEDSDLVTITPFKYKFYLKQKKIRIRLPRSNPINKHRHITRDMKHYFYNQKYYFPNQNRHFPNQDHHFRNQKHHFNNTQRMPLPSQQHSLQNNVVIVQNIRNNSLQNHIMLYLKKSKNRFNGI